MKGLVPELLVSDLRKSLHFYGAVCGFSVSYERAEEGFAMIEREESQLMLEELNPTHRQWVAAPLISPFGRGVNFQISVSDVKNLWDTVIAAGYVPYLKLEERWYRVGLEYLGQRQFIVQDPDGYLLRFAQNLGRRDTAPDKI